jgi:predicted DNA-binding transcriptional regulator AlpA
MPGDTSPGLRSIVGATPALLSVEQLVQLLGRSPSWFYAHRASLEQTGFPKRDPLLGRWHRAAVESWLARRAGVKAIPASPPSSKLRQAIDAHADALRHSAR